MTNSPLIFIITSCMPVSLLNLVFEALGSLRVAPWHDHTGYFSYLPLVLHLLVWIFLDFDIYIFSNGFPLHFLCEI